jgi:hypothetical protein
VAGKFPDAGTREMVYVRLAAGTPMGNPHLPPSTGSRLAALLAAMAALCPPALAAPAQPAVEALLDQGQIEQAMAALEARPGDPAAVSSLLVIRAALPLLDRANAYEQQGSPDRALAALAELDKLSGIHGELALRRGLVRRALALEKRLAEREDAAAGKVLETADALAADERFEDALRLYAEVAAGKPPLSPALIARAREARLATEVARMRGERFWSKQGAALAHSGTTLLFWLLTLAAAALLAWGATALLARLRGPQPGVVVRMEDLTAAGPAAARAGRQLAVMLSRRLTGMGADASGRPDVDGSEDFDRAGLANLRLEAKETSDLGAIADAEAVRFGAVSFTPRQLYELVKGAFERPYAKTVSGSLLARGDKLRLIIRVEKKEKGQPAVDAGARAWETDASQNGDAQPLLDEAADYVAFELAPWKAAATWPSFRDYRAASRLLEEPAEPAVRQRVLERASVLLRAAMGDPTNYLARFRMALVLRKLGRNAEAQVMLEHLRTLIEDTAHRPQALTDLCTNNPGFELTVHYNLAVTLGKLDDARSNKRAGEEFEALIQRLADVQGPGEEERRMCSRLEMSALAGKAAARLWVIERKRPRSSVKTPPAVEEAFFEIEDIKNGLEAAGPHREMDPHGHGAALAVALNAYGRACYLFNDNESARAAMVSALFHNPGLACAHINLAQVYRRLHQRVPDWARRAEIHAREALERSPNNPKAHYLLGLACKSAKNFDFETARTHLAAAGAHPSAAAALAELLADRQRTQEAMEVLLSSVRMVPQPYDHRYELIVTWAALIPPALLTPALVAGAESAAAVVLDPARHGGNAPSENEKARMEQHLATVHRHAAAAHPPLGAAPMA